VDFSEGKTMLIFRARRRTACISFIALITLGLAAASAESSPTIRGTITDPSGAVVINATVELLASDQVVSTTHTNSEGQYTFAAFKAGQYQVRASAEHLKATLSPVINMTASTSREADLRLGIESLNQQVTVTATGIPTTEGQLGAAVTVLDEKDYAHMREIQDPLRLIPGLQVTQSGQPGGTAQLYIRGGNSDANKVLVDGIPLDDIGGNVEFANVATTGIAQIEVLRGPNSALYGSDALAGVVSMSTARGVTALPQLTYQIDGGNFGTYLQEGTLGGIHKQFDYFADYSRFDTANSIPKNQFHNGTLVTNFGWNLNPTTSLQATLRHDRIASGQPNAIELYGIPSDTKQQNEDAYFGVTLNSQTNERWHNLLRYGGIRLRSNFREFAPTGIPQYDGQGNLLDYLGAPVTIRGANGYTVSGQAVYQYVQAYPNEYPTSSDLDFVYAQSDYRFNPHVVALLGFKYEDERGYSGGPSNSIERGNYSYTLQLQGDLKNRFYYTVGSGIEDNALFGIAGTPRASLAYTLIRPGQSRIFSGTKLRASFGKGIKEPSLLDQTTSLYALLAALPNGQQLISQYGVSQIGAEYSRTFDGGVDQDLFNGRARIGLTYFHNEFTNGIEYIPQQGLLDLGVPAAVVDLATFGATVNSQAFQAQGVETEIEYQLAHDWFARGGYTYLDAVVQRSFSSDAIGPSFNPNFPNVPIGIDTPLVGARPFRRAPHTGYFGLGYNHSRFSALLTGTLVGSRDDSDFLSADANGGTSLILPNRNLDGAYQKLDFSGGYQVSSLLNVYSSFQNLLSQHHSQAFGYPSLPFTFRSGIKLTFGGDSWKPW